MRYSSFLDWIDETCRKVTTESTTEVEVDPKCGDAFSDDFFDNERMRRLGDALKEDTTVTRFVIRNVPLGQKGCDYLQNLLTINRGLAVVVLEDTRGNGTDLAIAIAKALSENRSVEVLHLKANGISSEGCAALGRMLAGNDHLKELRLCHNRIECDAAMAFSCGLAENTTLQTLDLTGNSMDDSCIASVCKGLINHPALTFLCFDFNNFGTAGVDAIAAMLRHNTILQDLHLFGNHINEDGGRLLATSLAANRCLLTLILSFNDLGDTGAACLAKSLEDNSTLKKLWLPANHLGNDGIRAFAERLPRMKGLKQLNVGDYFDNDGVRVLKDNIKLNMELEVLYMESVLYDDEVIERDVDFYIRANRAGRRLFRHTDFPLTLWSNVLARANQFNQDGPDVLYYLLREKPDLFEQRLSA